MSLSTPFIHRPIATMLLTLGLALVGAVSYFLLPVAPLPQVDYPTISVSASLPGASPDTVAATVATPLERALGSIAGVNEITSRSILGSTNITLQFDLSRDVDSAARDVQAAINAARSLLPTGMPSNPTYRKVNPGGFAHHDPGAHVQLAHARADVRRGLHRAGAKALAGRRGGAGHRERRGAACGACVAGPGAAGGQWRVAGAGAQRHQHHQRQPPAGRGRA